MKILIAEDDFISRKFMLRFLSKYGECDVTVDGTEAVEAFTMALEAKEGYDLVCLDIMMPVMDGYQALKKIRDIEKEMQIPEEKAAKIIMTTALSEGKNVTKAFSLGCTAYAGKPIDQEKFENVLRKLDLIGSNDE
ncbi:response regulator [Lachnospiraceae bacterium MD1]|jgi:two-component system chemotaxis response regulator CheY|uniref:Stage 0 sporulation protein A homolog n=1 Tax=Variimorphobacter saccharofermentans TaxID=2755051 RepID=A0A839JXI3_9FIRM|nr:response regulator [Variimorphobacter saccharofermentans]MBB2181938.1 response regulator [Variimorphobacter saccharofermentans]